MARHDVHFVNKRSIANLGVVMGQRTHLFYKPPRGALMREYMDGMYYALLEGRFLFDFVHEDKLAPGGPGEVFRAAAAQHRAAQRRAVPAVARLCGCRRFAAGDVRDQPVHRAQPAARRFRPGRCVRHSQDRRRRSARLGNAYLARIEKQHEILSGFSGYPLDSRARRIAYRWLRWMSPILTVVPGFVAYPPELSYPLQARTERAGGGGAAEGREPPGLLSRAISSAPCGDPAIPIWHGCCRTRSAGWRAANPPVTIEGDGVIETFAWETQAGFAVHILNYTNPAMHRGWIRNFYPIGAQKVRMSLPQGRRVTRVELLRAETNIPFTGGSGKIEFTIPRVLDYEVAALYST